MTTNYCDSNILDHFGGDAINSLSSILGGSEDPDDNTHDVTHTPYIERAYLCNSITKFTNTFTVLNLNTQSLSSKFDELLVLLTELKTVGFEFSVLCFQETWFKDHQDISMFNLKFYTTQFNYHYTKSRLSIKIFLKRLN